MQAQPTLTLLLIKISRTPRRWKLRWKLPSIIARPNNPSACLEKETNLNFIYLNLRRGGGGGGGGQYIKSKLFNATIPVGCLQYVRLVALLAIAYMHGVSLASLHQGLLDLYM